MAAKCEMLINCSKKIRHLQKTNMTAKHVILKGS